MIHIDILNYNTVERIFDYSSYHNYRHLFILIDFYHTLQFFFTAFSFYCFSSYIIIRILSLLFVVAYVIGVNDDNNLIESSFNIVFDQQHQIIIKCMDH